MNASKAVKPSIFTDLKEIYFFALYIRSRINREGKLTLHQNDMLISVLTLNQVIKFDYNIFVSEQ